MTPGGGLPIAHSQPDEHEWETAGRQDLFASIMKIYLNGQIIEASDAFIPITDRSFLFGEGIFETFRTYDGKIPFLEKHLNRLEWSAAFVGLPCPHPQEIKEGIKKVLSENQLENARVKVVLSGLNPETAPGKISLATTLLTDSSKINLLIFCGPVGAPTAKEYEKGVSLGIIHSVRNEPHPISTIKSTSRLTKMVAMKEIAEKNLFDGILLNSTGHVTETTTSNIFWVSGEKIYTPPLTAGLLQGVTRDVVMEDLKKGGVDIREALITPTELILASEIFLTSSILEVMPVSEIDSQKIGSGKPGPVTKRVIKLYETRLEQEI